MFEIRNYHYDPTKFEAYKEWAINDAVPYLKANLDIVGFWIDNGIEPELLGADPDANKHGSANVTWVIRWDSKEARNQGHQDVFQGEGWLSGPGTLTPMATCRWKQSSRMSYSVTPAPIRKVTSSASVPAAGSVS